MPRRPLAPAVEKPGQLDLQPPAAGVPALQRRGGLARHARRPSARATDRQRATARRSRPDRRPRRTSPSSIASTSRKATARTVIRFHAHGCSAASIRASCALSSLACGGICEMVDHRTDPRLTGDADPRRDREGAPFTPCRAIRRLIGTVLAALPLFAGYVLILFDGKRRGFQDRFVARWSSRRRSCPSPARGKQADGRRHTRPRRGILLRCRRIAE